MRKGAESLHGNKQKKKAIRLDGFTFSIILFRLMGKTIARFPERLSE
jgi:hypothetical protein